MVLAGLIFFFFCACHIATIYNVEARRANAGIYLRPLTPPSIRQEQHFKRQFNLFKQQLQQRIKKLHKSMNIILKDKNRELARYDLPPITITNALIALNVLIFTITKGIPPILRSNPQVFRSLMKSNGHISSGQFYRLLTSLFCHGDFYHIFLNSYSLLQIGPVFNALLGPERLLYTYLVSGIAANGCTFLLNMSPLSIGASSCIFGLYGALLVYWKNEPYLRNRIDLEFMQRQILLNMVFGFTGKNIDNGAHVFGFLAGALLQELTSS